MPDTARRRRLFIRAEDLRRALRVPEHLNVTSMVSSWDPPGLNVYVTSDAYSPVPPGAVAPELVFVPRPSQLDPDSAGSDPGWGTNDILRAGREIWGSDPMSLTHVAACAAVVAGDIARIARDAIEGAGSDEGVARELGNLIVSAVRWADDLGFDPAQCVQEALSAQQRYVYRRGR